jgi:hypothetical protein
MGNLDGKVAIVSGSGRANYISGQCLVVDGARS